MIARAMLFLTLLPLSLLAQLQVLEFDGTNDTPVGSLVNVGTATPGDTITIRFHVRNTGAGPASFGTLSLAGQGFSIASAPSLPYILSPYVDPASEVEFDVDFSPTSVGSFSAFVVVNALSIALQGTSIVEATLSLAGSQAPLTAGAVVKFGSVDVGASQSQSLVLSNAGSASVTVSSVTVAGSGFQGPIGLITPAEIGPGQSASFQVSFTPQSGVAYRGTLTVDGRAFILNGQGLNPPLPSATLVFASNLGASAQQNTISIPLATASQVIGNGTLTMAFQSSVAGITDDPAIQFLSGPLRQASVNVAIGATAATIGGKSGMAFQTGTTAGTITFTLTLGSGAPQQVVLVIPPSAVILDTFTAVRELTQLNVAFAGFDNTYSASQLAFTFYDLTGKALPQGTIDVDASSTFQQYFSASQAGGMFQMLAIFPVSGNSAEVGFVSAQVANALGTTPAPKIAIGN